jgi:predicted transcriptional regulator of viral defense system
MVEGGVYSTEILTGENADRFKVLIKKSVSISDVEELEVNITNNNRHISIETTETDLQVEVYNALGQKVLSTKDRNFTLNQVSAGAYLIKAFNNKASKTQKIVVE